MLYLDLETELIKPQSHEISDYIQEGDMTFLVKDLLLIKEQGKDALCFLLEDDKRIQYKWVVGFTTKVKTPFRAYKSTKTPVEVQDTYREIKQIKLKANWFFVNETRYIWRVDDCEILEWQNGKIENILERYKMDKEWWLAEKIDIEITLSDGIPTIIGGVRNGTPVSKFNKKLNIKKLICYKAEEGFSYPKEDTPMGHLVRSGYKFLGV